MIAEEESIEVVNQCQLKETDRCTKGATMRQTQKQMVLQVKIPQTFFAC